MQLTDNELVTQWQKLSCIMSRNGLVLRHVGFVKSKAFKMHPNEIDDYIQVGVLGLMRAADTFDATKNCKFLTHAAHYIKAEFIRYSAQNGNHGVNFHGKSEGVRKMARLRPTPFETEKELLNFAVTNSIPIEEARAYHESQVYRFYINESKEEEDLYYPKSYSVRDTPRPTEQVESIQNCVSKCGSEEDRQILEYLLLDQPDKVLCRNSLHMSQGVITQRIRELYTKVQIALFGECAHEQTKNRDSSQRRRGRARYIEAFESTCNARKLRQFEDPNSGGGRDVRRKV